MDGKIQRLLDLVHSPEKVKGVWAMVQGKYPAFPKDACGATLSTFLSEAGFDQSFLKWAQSAADEAEHEGWNKVGIFDPPMPGDIFVCGDLNGNGATDHVGIVVMPTGQNNFWAIDNRTNLCVEGRPYVRNINGGPYTPVAYWLRYDGKQEV